MVLMDRSGLRVRNTTDIHENMECLDGATIVDLVLSFAFAGVRAFSLVGPGEADRFVPELRDVSAVIP